MLFCKISISWSSSHRYVDLRLGRPNRNIHEKLFSQPDGTLVYPGHDYKNRHVSTIVQERERNPRLGHGKSLGEFVKIVSELNLRYPRFIDYAVPGNRLCGVCPEDLTDHLKQYCEKMETSVRG